MPGLMGRAKEATRWLRAKDLSADIEFDPDNYENGSGVGKLLSTLKALKMTPDQQLETVAEKFFTLSRVAGDQHVLYMNRANDVR